MPRGVDTDEVLTEVPGGIVGSTVDVRVVTAESLATDRAHPRTPLVRKDRFTVTEGPPGGSRG